MKKFLQQVLSSTIGSFAGLLLFFLLTGGGFIVLLIALVMSGSNNTTARIENQSALVFNLSSQISDYPPDEALPIFIANNNLLTLHQITTAIEKAATDDRITAIYLDGTRGNVFAGYATLTEIRNALVKFRESGKKIIAYNISAGERDYFLTSVADEINLNPMGVMEVNGLASSQLFFANAFDKYGIGVQIIRVGKYKSAIEPFIRTNFSAESKLQNSQLLDDIWTSYLDTVTQNRDIAPDRLNTIADNQGFLGSKEAQQLKLIDQISYQDEIIDRLKTITNSQTKDTFRQIDIKTYFNATSSDEQYNDNQIAILYLEGAIVDGEGQTGQVGSSRYINEIRKVRKNKNIKGVVVRINSPGGSAIASELILRELQLTAKKIPVVVSMGDVAASGGYWIATGGEKIFANPSTVTGSIGVFGVLFNVRNIAQENGINNDVVKTNEFADVGNVFQEKTDAEIAVYQDSVDRTYEEFLNKVAQARDLPLAKVQQVAQGRIWSGKSAVENGLVDEIGGLSESIEYLNEKLDLKNQYKVVNYPTPRTFETEFLSKLATSKINANNIDRETLAKMILASQTELELKQILENPAQVYSILPYKINIK